MSYGLGIGLRALTAARLAIQTAGQNVANANTPGYSRQQALLSSTAPTTLGRMLQIGTGVQVDTIRRVVDERLDSRIRTQTSSFGQAAVENDRYREIEGLLGVADDSGLTGLLPGFFEAATALKGDSRDRAQRGAFIQSARSLGDEFRLVSSRLGALKEGTHADVTALANDVNTMATGIARLNTTIMATESGGQKANDLRDQREGLMRQISELVGARAIERPTGMVDVLVDGQSLVAGERANPLVAQKGTTGLTEVRLKGGTQAIRMPGGRLGGLLNAEGTQIPALTAKLDVLARSLILESNRIHSTGVPASGSFTSLVSEHQVRDGDGDGQFTDELLKASGLPFDMAKGDLFLTVVDKATGKIERTKVAIDPSTMTFGELASGLDAAEHVTASLDSTGRLRITADAGFGFDFSLRLDSAPDQLGSFGGANAVAGGGKGGPFGLTVPATFTVAVDGGAAQTVTLLASNFRNPAAADASEIAVAISAQLTGAKASVVGGRVVIQSDSSGPTSSLQLTEGAGGPLNTLGLTGGLLLTGTAMPVEVSISGRYTGAKNDQLRFVTEGTGQIGVTPGLKVGVYDKAGARVALLDVGKGYSPGDKLAVSQGVTVSFGPGSLSADAKHQFALDTLADSDTSDALVALGLNVLFKGSSAADIGVSSQLEADPDLLSAGLTGASGDGDNIGRLLEMRNGPLDSLGGQSIEDFQGYVVGELGFAAKGARELAESQGSILDFLDEQRQAISGVSIDEEMIDLVRFQQSFQAASRLITTLSDMTQTLIEMAR